MVHPDRFGPGTGGIGGGHKKIATGIQERRDQVKRAVVITQGRGINAAGSPGVVEVQLAFAGQAVSELPPVHQVPAVKNRNARKKFKRAVDQVIIVTDPANAWVGVKAGEDGILKGFGGSGRKTSR